MGGTSKPGPTVGRCLAGAALLALISSAAPAEELVERGYTVASTSCAACHLVEGSGDALALHAAVARPLRVIAEDAALTEEEIRALLADQHPVAPLELTPEEIEALMAYIGSLHAQ